MFHIRDGSGAETVDAYESVYCAKVRKQEIASIL